MEKKQETEPGPLDCQCNLSLEVEASSDSLVEETSIKLEFCQNCFVEYDPKLDKCKCNEGIIKKPKKSKNVGMLESFTETKPGKMNTKENAILFLEKRKIHDFFNFLICHLLVRRPEDPIEFLINLLDDCMFFRAGLRKAPLLYEDTHLHGMVASFDPINQSYLTFDQYKTAFSTLRLDNYNKFPPVNSENLIRGSFFVTEANGLMTAHLASMVKIHKITTCQC